MAVTLGQQYNVGEKTTVILYTKLQPWVMNKITCQIQDFLKNL